MWQKHFKLETDTDGQTDRQEIEVIKSAKK